MFVIQAPHSRCHLSEKWHEWPQLFRDLVYISSKSHIYDAIGRLWEVEDVHALH